MKKALVYYLYGNRNAGDMAICIGTIELLKKQGYEITMVSRFSEAEDEYQRSKDYISEYYPEVKVYPGPFSFERSFSVAKKLAAYTDSMMKVAGIIPDKQTKELIRESDVVFFNGGNLLRGASTADYLRLMALFYPIKIAHAMGKPVYCLPQSTAKISDCGERMLGKYLQCFETIYVREKISFEELKKRFPSISFVQSTDMAFLCADTKTAVKKYDELELDIGNKTVAVVVRNTGIGDIGELDIEKQKMMKRQLTDFVQSHKDYHFIIVIQTEKDREFSQQVFEMAKQIAEAELIENYDPLLLREIYKRVEFLITMRLHAGILSLSALTPVIGLFSGEWGFKNPGIMSDYEMPYVMIENIEGNGLANLEPYDKNVYSPIIDHKIESFSEALFKG